VKEGQIVISEKPQISSLLSRSGRAHFVQWKKSDLHANLETAGTGRGKKEEKGPDTEENSKTPPTANAIKETIYIRHPIRLEVRRKEEGNEDKGYERKKKSVLAGSQGPKEGGRTR